MRIPLLFTGDSHAALFFGGTVRDLNSLANVPQGWVMNVAHGINASGQIIGDGTFGGKNRGFLLTPDTGGIPSTPDKTRPVIRVAGPKNRTTALTRGVVTGSATDDLSVHRIEYQVGKGRYRAALGATSWRFTAKLPPGKSRLRVRAIDGAGNVSLPVTITIKRQ